MKYKVSFDGETYATEKTEKPFYWNPKMNYMLDPNWYFETDKLYQGLHQNIDGWFVETTDLLPMKEEAENDIIWSTERTRTLNFSDFLKNSILTRYAMLDRPAEGEANVVIDSFVPRLMVASHMSISRMRYISNLPKSAVAISPWFANIFGVKQLSTEQMCRILGYSSKDIKKLITETKKNRYNITFVGYGGVGVNTIHWLTEMCKFTNTINLFEQVIIHEPDKLELSNLLRFPKDPAKALPTGDTNYFKLNKLQLLAKDEINILSKNNPVLYGHRVRHSNKDKYHKNHIFYGAPDLSTRTVLSSAGKFISATHADNNCSLHLNPSQDTDLQVESYGMIQLAPFFMNQLRIAIGLLEVLTTRKDFTEENVELLNYTFTGESVLSTDRKYKFQMNYSGLMTTPEEAENV